MPHLKFVEYFTCRPHNSPSDFWVSPVQLYFSSGGFPVQHLVLDALQPGVHGKVALMARVSSADIVMALLVECEVGLLAEGLTAFHAFVRTHLGLSYSSAAD